MSGMFSRTIALAGAVAMIATGAAQAAIGDGVLNGRAPLANIAQVENAQLFIFGGRNYCWYPEGWRGPGWYWCGYEWSQGFGWGGPFGWHGWGGGRRHWTPGERGYYGRNRTYGGGFHGVTRPLGGGGAFHGVTRHLGGGGAFHGGAPVGGGGAQGAGGQGGDMFKK
jgi:hypothetical protein